MGFQQSNGLLADFTLVSNPPSLPSSNVDPDTFKPNIDELILYGHLLQTFDNPEPDDRENFGLGVATTPRGDLIIAARHDNAEEGSSGSVYLYDRETGNLLLHIKNPSPKYYDTFGEQVASTPSGDILVGTYKDDTGFTNSGTVYLFDGYNGNLLLTINNPSPAEDDHFGISIATTPNGDIIVGASGDNTGEPSAGIVYIFDGTNGALLLTIPNPTPYPDDKFGSSVASTPNGDIIVGARNDHPANDDFSTGTVFLFDSSYGDQLLRINNPDPNEDDKFGARVASTYDNNILVTALWDDTGANGSGSVYLFDGATGDLLLTFLSPDPEFGDDFGSSLVPTPNGNVYIGEGNGSPNHVGSVHHFDGTTGELLKTINNPDPQDLDAFGFSMALIPNGDLLIGEPANDPTYPLRSGETFTSISAGSAHVFKGKYNYDIPLGPIEASRDITGSLILKDNSNSMQNFEENKNPTLRESSQLKVPDWVKTTTSFWTNDNVSDTEFIDAIGFLVREQVIQLDRPIQSHAMSPVSSSVPDWIKETSQWWIEGQIPEDQFLAGITWLIENNIIVVDAG